MKQKLRSAFDPRQYMLSQDFEVFYYSDLHFQSVGPHAHDYYEFYFFVEGAVEMVIDGEAHPLRPGDVIVVPPGVEHRALIRDGELPYRRFVLWLSRDYCEALAAQSPDYLYLPRRARQRREYVYPFDTVAFNALRAKLFALLDEIHAQRFGREPRLSLCIGDLLLHLAREVYRRDHPQPRQESLSPYQAITAYVEQHLEEELSLEGLSARFYLSKFYIAHLFQENTGLSLHRYITKKRLAACCDAIQSGVPVTAAYSACGFRDYSVFYRAFKKEYGMTPSEYQGRR